MERRYRGRAGVIGGGVMGEGALWRGVLGGGRKYPPCWRRCTAVAGVSKKKPTVGPFHISAHFPVKHE